MNDTLMLLTMGLSVIGGIAFVIQVLAFVAETKQSRLIERREVIRTMRRVLASGLWSGSFFALAVLLIMQEGNNTKLSAWGTAALLLSIMIAITALFVVGFSAEILNLRVFVLPDMQEKARRNSSDDPTDDSDL